MVTILESKGSQKDCVVWDVHCRVLDILQVYKIVGGGEQWKHLCSMVCHSA